MKNGTKVMYLNDYQVKSKRTLNQELTKEQTVSNMIMGILGETGEVADVIKKHYYQGHDLDIEHIKEEIGDVMFYIVNLCNVLDLDLEAFRITIINAATPNIIRHILTKFI